ncbi:MAG TPA: hypothetical protein EYP35_06165 [Desulfobacterales bacterium]|nr:hypothetical protein [Desulfobacterales bacterium]
MKYLCINLTPHEITIYHEEGVLKIPPSGHVARVITANTEAAPVTIRNDSKNVKIPTVKREPKGLDLPPPDKFINNPKGVASVTLLVSAMVGEYIAQHGLPAQWIDLLREGVVVTVAAPDTGPDSVVRDENGRIIGVRRLVVFTRLPE